MAAKHRQRVRVGWYADAIAPVTNVRLQMRLARLLGADDLWLGDHVAHVIPNTLWKTTPMARFVPNLDAWFDPTALIARYARRRGLRMGVVTDPFRRSAADLARAWLSLHHVTGGNAVLGIGAGERMNLDPIGEDWSQPVSHLADTLGALRAVLSSEGRPVSHEGPFHRWEQAPFLPPYRGSVPPVWVAAEGPNACELAGRYGDGWISYSTVLKTWVTAAERVASGAVAAGKDPEELDRCLFATAVLVATPAHIERVCAAPLAQALPFLVPARAWSAVGLLHPLGEDFSGVQGLDTAIFEGDRWEELRRQVTPEVVTRLFPAGDAHQIAEFLAEFVDHGVTQIVFLNLTLMAGNSMAGVGITTASLIEQRKLIRLLKSMRPGTLQTGANR